MPSAYLSPRLVAAISLLLGIPAAFSQEILTIEDQGSPREFELVEDEVLLTGKTENGDRLRQDVEVAIAGAKVLETRGSEALTKLDKRIDRRRAAARLEPMQKAAPEYRSEPVLYPKNAIRTVHSRRYVGPRVLAALGEGQTLEQLRAQAGAVEVKKAPLEGHAILTFADGWKSLAASEELAGRGVQARPLLRRYVEKMSVPNDPYYLNQWHLKNRGQDGGVVGIDANINTAWDTARGAGVTVVVVDDSLQTTHPDFAGNVPDVSTGLHRDFRNDDANPAPTASDDAHGTSVGGVIGARGDNNLGVSGAAPEARLLGIRLIGGFFDAFTAYEALNWEPTGVTSSVSNNSWGYRGTGMISLDPLERQALQDAATLKRGGRGQVTLFAAANNDEVFNGFFDGEPVFTSQDANYQPYASSRFVIGVGACTNFGDHSYYSNRGASVLICAPSNGGSLGIFTTDNVGTSGYNSLLDPAGQPSDRDYTNSFGGTSSATPLTSGVVALMLSANPDLGYRDVQEILATTARKIDPFSSDWVTNEAGFHFAHAYGAGMVDATAAVLRAGQWTNLPPVATYSRTATNLPAQIIDGSATLVSRSFDFSTSPNLRLEHVEVVLRATHGNRSDLEIALTSPSGTRSILNPIRERPNELYTGDNDNNIGSANGGWVYMTTHNWGENSSGTWTLTARDGRSGTEGTLDSAQVRIYGTPAGMQRVRFTQQQIVTQETATTVNLSVERSGETTNSVTVGYAVVGGSATNGADYTLANGTLTFGPGESQKNVAVAIIDDDVPESSESIYVVLTEPTGARLGGNSLCSLIIGASDGNLVSITAADREAAETAENLPGNPVVPKPGSFRISRLVADENPLIVPIVVSGTATFGIDYETIPASQAVPTSVTIPGGTDSVLITIMPRFDELTEGVEYVTITLAPPDPAADYELGEPSEATVILADDELQAVSIIVEQNQTQLPETGAQSANLIVARDGGASTELNVGLLIGGSAQPGIDYIELPDSVSFAVGESQKVLTVTPKDNDFFNPTRTVAVAIAPGSEYHQGFNKSVNIQIGNDEPVPDPTKPTVTIVAPSSNQRITPAPTAQSPLVATGTAKDNLEVVRVLYRINQSDWALATLAEDDTPNEINWSVDITAAIRPGPNLLEARSEDEDGNISSVVATSFTIVVPRTLTVQVTGPGSATPGTGTYEAGQPYKLTAKPQKGQIFAGWSGALVGSSKTLFFTMPDEDATVIATFVSNPFAEAVTGRYTGLLAGSTPAHATSGMIDVVVAKAGKFSGKVWHSGKAYRLKGEFNGSGKFDGQIKRPLPLIPLTVSLTLDLNPAGTQQITGSVAGELEPSVVDAHRAPFHAKKNPLSTEVARAYTFYLPPKYPNSVQGNNMSTLAPHGNGVATLSISTSGVVKWTGTLGDGTKATQSTVLNAAHRWPLYLSLYKGEGYIGGPVAHDATQGESDLAGSLNWAKLPIATDRIFPGGFMIEDTWLLGVNYTAPAKGQRVLTSYDAAPANTGPLSLVEGNLTPPGIAKTLSLATTNKTTILPAGEDKLRISIAAKTGIVSGSFVFPVTRKLVPIKGVILQNKIGKGVGMFTGTTLSNLPLQTGRLEFKAATP